MKRMSKSRLETVNKWSLLGFNFYEKVRLEAYDVPQNFTFNEEIDIYAGLLFLHDYSGIETNYVKLFSNKDIKKKANLIYRHSICYLLAKGDVQLLIFRNKKKILGGLISFGNNEYHLKIKNQISYSERSENFLSDGIQYL